MTDIAKKRRPPDLKRRSRCITLLVALLCPLMVLPVASVHADTDVCVGPTTTTTVTTIIKVQPGDQFNQFVRALRSFARHNHFDWAPSASNTGGNVPGQIDIALIKAGTSQAIHIHNGQIPEEIVATMSECGNDEFRPYWREFMAFVKKYAASRPNYPY
jgi:hypothetical protein